MNELTDLLWLCMSEERASLLNTKLCYRYSRIYTYLYIQIILSVIYRNFTLSETLNLLLGLYFPCSVLHYMVKYDAAIV